MALLLLPLSACSSLAGQTLEDAWGGSLEVHREQARKLPYASLLVNAYGNQSLLVLAYQAGEPDDATTLWQARDQGTLTLTGGRLFSTAGFGQDLLSLTRDRIDSTGETSAATAGGRYRVISHWQEADGADHRAQGLASWQCHTPESVSLPLTTLVLERCEETVDWQRAGVSHNTLWRDPETQRPWAGTETPWPGADPIAWQVARPWW